MASNPYGIKNPYGPGGGYYGIRNPYETPAPYGIRGGRMMAKDPEWKEIRAGRQSVMVGGFDSMEDVCEYLAGKPLATVPEDDAPMAWYLDQLGDA